MSSQHPAEDLVFWRVEGSLLNILAVRSIAFFTWNSQSFLERWGRRGGLAIETLFRPFLYALHRKFATRVLHSLLRGVSRDRLDLLGEEYFEYVMKPRLKPAGIGRLQQELAAGKKVVLVGQSLEHILRPLARHLGVERILANRLDFRDGLATGRMSGPVIRPRGGLARVLGGNPDGRVPFDRLCRDLALSPEQVLTSIVPARRPSSTRSTAVVLTDARKRVPSLSVHESLADKHILLIGVTGFIGKVWLANLLYDLPEIGKIYLLIRRQGSTSALRRFERIVADIPVFDALHERYGDRLAAFLHERVEVIEGDVTRPGLGLEPETAARLRRDLDVVINSSGLTEFNPDLRDALSANVDAVMNVLEFVRACDHAALLHLSTCYVVGFRDGRIREELIADYSPAGVAGFDAERELDYLRDFVRQAEEFAEGPEATEDFRRQAIEKSTARHLSGTALDNQVRKNRIRWLRNHLTQAGTGRAREHGWPNTYTFSKSLAESLIQKRAAGLPVAIVRPSIVETSLASPFRGWNEGINTSSGLSYLLGTFFRQLPTTESKCLDIIPVDLVTRGMTLIAAALVERCHQPLYHLATSARNPCNMRRSIELTGLAHRKFYRSQQGFGDKLRLRFDAIPVSKKRYTRFSAPAQRAFLQRLRKIAAPFPFKRPPFAKVERGLNRTEKLIELYEPFILRNDHIFEAENVELLSAALPPEEQDAFGYDATVVDWWEYWINVHVPALRKYSYPLIEGRPLDYRNRRQFNLAPQEAPGPALRTEATWPPS